MTSRSRNWPKYEIDISKGRDEGNWRKIIELGEIMKSKSPSSECLALFLIGEGKLESYLDENPPTDVNTIKARSGLAEPKRHLQRTIEEDGKQAGFERCYAFLLLGKINYAMGLYEEVLANYDQAELSTSTEKQLNSRSLRIMAESYAIKGLCLEKVPPPSSSKYKQAEWEEQRLRCFELAGDLALRYLQEQEKLQQFQPSTTGSSSPQPPDAERKIGPILETALQRAPILHIQGGNIQPAITRYRVMLMAKETAATQGIRQTLARQLGEVLLHEVTGNEYIPPDKDQSLVAKKTKFGTTIAGSPWKPHVYDGIQLFVPRNENEEIILLFLISEAMAARDAVLSQTPEFKDARILAYKNATALYDLITISLVRWGYIDVVLESFERAMKFSFEEPHTWMQKALALVSLGHYERAYLVLKEVIRLSPNKVLPCLLAARICYEHLNLLNDGIELSNQALARDASSPQNLTSRCHLHIGIGYSLQATNAHIKQEKQQLVASALEAFQRAQQTDPNDHLPEYYMAMLCAQNGQLYESIPHVKVALNLNAEHVPSLQLFILLLSALKQTAEALTLVDCIIEEYPENMNLYYIKAQLQLHHIGGEQALNTARKMLELWKNLYEKQINSELAEINEKRSDTRSLFQFHTSELSDKDSSSLHAHSLAASRVEHTLSEVASSLSSFTPKPGPQKAWNVQLQIWLLLSEIYLSMGNVKEASECIVEAMTIFPVSHHIMYMRGLVHEYKKEFNEAKLHFQNAIAINPTHIKSLQHLGLVYHHLGCQRLAEKTLREAARIDPSSYQTWYNLGHVLEAMEEFDSASDSMAAALEVENTSPVLPYSIIPLTFE